MSGVSAPYLRNDKTLFKTLMKGGNGEKPGGEGRLK